MKKSEVKFLGTVHFKCECGKRYESMVKCPCGGELNEIKIKCEYWHKVQKALRENKRHLNHIARNDELYAKSQALLKKKRSLGIRDAKLFNSIMNEKFKQKSLGEFK